MSIAAFCACGFAPESTAPRCRSCPATPPPMPQPTAASDAPRFRTSRWAKGPHTFGPAGRVIATLLLLVPLPLLLMAVASGIGIIGAGIYALVLLPWALRDVWKPARVPMSPL